MNQEWYHQFFQGTASNFWDRLVSKKFTEEETAKLQEFFKEHNINGKVAKEKVAEIAEEMGKNIKSIATKFQHIAKTDRESK